MYIDIEDLEPIAKKWSRYYLKKDYSDTSLGVGIGIVIFSIIIMILFSLGENYSMAHLGVPAFLLLVGIVFIIRGYLNSRKLNMAKRELDDVEPDKVALIEETISYILALEPEKNDNALDFIEGKEHLKRYEKPIFWQGEFRDNRAIVAREDPKMIYFLTRNDLLIEAKESPLKEAEEGDLLKLSSHVSKRIKMRMDNISARFKDLPARFLMMDREFQGYISPESYLKYQKWQNGEFS